MPEHISHLMGRVKHIHFVGIGGVGMSGIAEVLHNLGYEVSGSDIKDSRITSHLHNLGINVVNGHASEYVNGSDVVVVSSAINEENPEVKAARQKRIPVVPRAEMLAELMRFRQGIAVAGTHGKTTTTSLIASMLAEAGLDPTYVIGGQLNSSASHARLGSGKYLVAEADESDASFLHLQPVISVLTNIDRDHLENYKDFDSLKHNFIEFIHHLPFYGLAVLCIDDPGIKSILQDVTKPYITYGIEGDADFNAHIELQEYTQSVFAVSRPGEKNWLKINLNLPGKHNVLNSLAAIAVASELNIPSTAIKSALENFQGINRRFEILGQINIDGKSVLLVDDYAHHPTEIRAILEAIRTGWGDRRIVVVFQPHRYTRTQILFKEFCEVLSEIDLLILLNIYPAGETEIPGIDSLSLCKEITGKSKSTPVLIGNRDELITSLPGLLNDEDILLILGAGDIGSLGNELFSKFDGTVH